MFCKIKSLDKKNFDGKVYNLEVEEDNSYCLLGCAVHNCDEKAEAEDSLFKTKNLIKCFDTRFKFEKKPTGGLVIISCDFGYSDNPRADDTVYVVIEKLDNFYIIRYIDVLPNYY